MGSGYQDDNRGDPLEDFGLNISAPGVLGDYGEVDYDGPFVVLVGNPAFGAVSLNGRGVVRYLFHVSFTDSALVPGTTRAASDGFPSGPRALRHRRGLCPRMRAKLSEGTSSTVG